MTVVFPNPAGADTRVSVASAARATWSLTRGRGTNRPCVVGRWNFVSSRRSDIGSPDATWLSCRPSLGTHLGYGRDENVPTCRTVPTEVRMPDPLRPPRSASTDPSLDLTTALDP